MLVWSVPGCSMQEPCHGGGRIRFIWLVPAHRSPRGEGGSSARWRGSFSCPMAGLRVYIAGDASLARAPRAASSAPVSSTNRRLREKHPAGSKREWYLLATPYTAGLQAFEACPDRNRLLEKARLWAQAKKFCSLMTTRNCWMYIRQ